MNDQISKKQIDALYNKNVLDYKTYIKLIGELGSGNWKTWLNKNLLFIGAALFIAGVIFFFAYNWFAMHKFIKLGICAALIIASALTAYFKKLDSFSAQAAAFMACFFIGAFMAVFGQVYQTGADAYELFFTWAVMVLPLAFVVNKTSVWVLFIVLVNTTYFLYFSDPYPWTFLLMNFIFFAAAKLPYAIAKQQTYFYYLIITFLSLAALLCAVGPKHGVDSFVYPVILFAWCALLFYEYFIRNKDIYFVGLSIIMPSVWLFVKIIDFGSFYRQKALLGIIALAMSCAVGFALVKLNSKMRGQNDK